jgi:hypothetical protein
MLQGSSLDQARVFDLFRLRNKPNCQEADRAGAKSRPSLEKKAIQFESKKKKYPSKPCYN